MPNLPIVDAHLHLWDPTHFRMSWLDGNPLLNRRYDLREYREQIAGLPIEAMVYVQVEVEPAYGLLEAHWAVERAHQEKRLQGIVAWAPLEDGAQAQTYLSALVAISPLIKGVRRVTQGEPDPTFCARPGFVQAVRLLPALGLSCDLCIVHTQLPGILELVRQCPETSFMLDHGAKPDIRNRVIEPWRSQVRELASFPNVFSKISGLVTEADHRHWTRDDLKPYVEHLIDTFGEDRIVFGGDWPVLLQAASYQRWVETLDDLTAGLSETARRKLWAENARRFYRLNDTRGRSA